jgi:hypothetical protein
MTSISTAQNLVKIFSTSEQEFLFQSKRDFHTKNEQKLGRFNGQAIENW